MTNQGVKSLHEQTVEWVIKIKNLRSAAALAIKALEEVEFVEQSKWICCPWCKAKRGQPHQLECLGQRALDALREAKS